MKIHRHHFHILVCLLLLLAFFLPMSLSATSSHAQSTKTLRVAIKPLKPFVMKQGDATYTGFSIDLWEAIAQRNGWQTDYVWHETVKELLASVQQDRADVGIAGISMTPEREAVLDFSYPMFNAGLQIMVPLKTGFDWRDSLNLLLNPDLLRILAAMLVLLLVAGHIIWLMSRKDEETYPRGYLRGVWEGIWWAAASVGTVNYGDRTPKDIFGRVFAIAWMFIGIALVANFTGAVTTNLTLQEIRGTVSGINDLPGKRVATVDGSTASRFLDTQGVTHQHVKTIEEAFALIETDKLDAIVYDAPVLRYYAAKTGQGKVRIIGALLKPEEYGIALPSGSPLREEVDHALLALQADGTYQQLYTRWFGE